VLHVDAISVQINEFDSAKSDYRFYKGSQYFSDQELYTKLEYTQNTKILKTHKITKNVCIRYEIFSNINSHITLSLIFIRPVWNVVKLFRIFLSATIDIIIVLQQDQ